MARDAPRKPRLVVLVSHPIQYHAPLYRCLAKRGIVDIKVLFLSDAGAVAHQDTGFGRMVEWDIPLLTGYDSGVLQTGSSITSRTFWSSHDPGLTAALERERPDWLLVYGYASRMNWVAVHWARRRGVRVAYSSDSNIRDPQSRRYVLLKHILLGHYFSIVDVFLATSEANLEYLVRFGADRRKIRRLPFAVEVERFRRPASEEAEGARPYDFVWAGKLIPLKRPREFLQALEIVARRVARPVRACMIGDGSLRAEVEETSRALPGRCRLEFRGFVNQREMPAALQAAETLVFTSEKEAYGLIATEAAASGLALLVADNIGCVGDTGVARPGVNALTYGIGDVDALAAAMERTLVDDELRRSMQRASIMIAEEHDVACAARAIESALAPEAAHA